MILASEFWLIFGMVLVTWSVRFPVLLLSGKYNLPHRIKRALNYVPVAVLTAISLPMLVRPEGFWAVNLDNPQLVAGMVAIVTAALSRNLLLTLIVGMSFYVLLKNNLFQLL